MFVIMSHTYRMQVEICRVRHRLAVSELDSSLEVLLEYYHHQLERLVKKKSAMAGVNYDRTEEKFQKGGEVVSRYVHILN